MVVFSQYGTKEFQGISHKTSKELEYIFASPSHESANPDSDSAGKSQVEGRWSISGNIRKY